MPIRKLAVFAASLLLMFPLGAQASTIVSGKIMIAEGHQQPLCRRLFLKQADGNLLTFRLPDTGKEDGILAVALTALTTGLTVDLSYTPGVGTGCGTEPLVEYVSLRAAGF